MNYITISFVSLRHNVHLVSTWYYLGFDCLFLYKEHISPPRARARVATGYSVTMYIKPVLLPVSYTHLDVYKRQRWNNLKTMRIGHTTTATL